MSEQIYDRVRREGRDAWHIVESTIAGAAITNCGLRMEPKVLAGELLWASSRDLTSPEVDVSYELCQTCGEGSLA